MDLFSVAQLIASLSFIYKCRHYFFNWKMQRKTPKKIVDKAWGLASATCPSLPLSLEKSETEGGWMENVEKTNEHNKQVFLISWENHVILVGLLVYKTSRDHEITTQIGMTDNRKQLEDTQLMPLSDRPHFSLMFVSRL